MANFTAKIGAVDISSYVRVNKGDGLDPLGAGWLDPQFNTSPFGEGQPLVNIDAKNRELVFPLFVRDTTKDALHNTLQQINREIAYGARPLRFEWKDSSATNSTFYDITFARIDPAFNYRLSDQEWADVALRVWCAPPYGHTATERIVATAAGSGAILTVNLPSPLIGDAMALTDYRIYAGSAIPRLGNGRIVGVAVLPHASQYTVEIPAASLIVQAGSVGWPQSATVLGASGAVGSQALALAGSGTSALATFSPLLRFSLSPASAYIGNNRIFAIARSAVEAGICMQLFDSTGNAVGGTAIATSHDDWSLIDLGVARVPSGVQLAATLAYQINGGMKSFNESGHRGAAWYGFPRLGFASAPNHAIHINELIVLPDDTLQLVVDDPGRKPLAIDTFQTQRAADGATYALYNIPDELGNTYTIPTGVAGATPFLALKYASAEPKQDGEARMVTAGGHYGFGGLRIEHTAADDIHIRTRVRLGRGNQASTGVMVRKSAGATSWIQGAIRHINASGGIIPATCWMALTAQTLAGPTLYASQAIQIATSIDSTLRLEMWNQGPQVTFNVRDVTAGATTVGGVNTFYASVGAIIPQAINKGVGELVGYVASSGSEDTPVIEDFSVDVVPSQAIGPVDCYELKGTAGDAYVATGGTPGGAAGVPVRRIADRLRGRTPGLTGGTIARIAVLEAPMESGAVNDLLSVEIRVRERFAYSR